MAKDQSHYRLGLLLVTAAAVAWSLSGLFTRAVAADTPTVLFWRGAFGTLGMLAIIALMPVYGGAGGSRRSGWAKLGWAGIAYAAVTALSMLLFISSLRHTSVAHVAVITAVVPFVAAYLGWLLLLEVPQPTAIVASIAALAGVALMVGVSGDGAWVGDALAFGMALCMGGMILISRRHRDIPALPATCLASALSAAVTLPFASVLAVSGQDLAVLALFALVNQVLGFGLFALGARYLPPMETALITALEAPLAPLWVFLVFSEVPAPITLAGGGIVLAAVLGHLIWESQRPR